MAHEPKPVAIIILSLNKREQTLRCLESVSRLDYAPYEVVVVDNGSTDGSADAVAHAFPRIHLVRSAENHGVAGGRNLGIAYARRRVPHRYCFFLDNDACVEPGTLRELVAAAEADAGVGMVTPKIYSTRGSRVIQCAGGHVLNLYTGRIRGIGSGQPDAGQCDQPRDVDSAPGVKLVRDDVFASVGVYDERFNPYGWEDVDLSLRARKAKFRIRYAPRAVVHHQGGKLGRGKERSAYEWSKAKNFFLLMQKHAGLLQWLCFAAALPFRMAGRVSQELSLASRRRAAAREPDGTDAPARQSAMARDVMSVVIPCRGHARQLEHVLRALQQQTVRAPFEVIVVNSEADPAVAEVAARFPGTRLIASREGLTPGEARNAGAGQARGGYLAFLDADCLPDPDWLAAALTALTAGATVVGGAVGDGHPLNPIAVADNLLQFVDFSPHRPDGVIGRIPSCNFALRKTSFDELGGFPGGLPTGEDGLFSREAAVRWPGEIRFTRTMRVRHMGRTTLRTFWSHQTMLGLYRGRLGVGLRQTWYQRCGGHTLFAIPVVGKRLGFLVGRTVRWNPAGLVRVVVLLPLLLVGLTAWAKAFRDGCRLAAKEAR